MSRNRMLLTLLAWLFPLLYVVALRLLASPKWVSDEVSVVLIFAGPFIFTVLLSSLVFVRAEDLEVRYARASRRLGYMCKIAALCVFVLSFPALYFMDKETHVFLPYLLGGLVVFLFISMVVLMFASMVFRMLQVGSAEDGGARDAFVVTAVMCLLAALLVPAVARSRPIERRPSCANNLKQFGLVFKMFANEHGGFYPELSREPGFLSMTNASDNYVDPVLPVYLNDPEVLICPSSRSGEQPEYVAGMEQELLNASSYVYLGYMVKDEQELETFFQCYKERVAAGLPFNEDLPAPPGRGSGGGDKILRLREGGEMVYVKQPDNPAASAIAQSKIPVMFDRNPENHTPTGVNLLYMDGHVEFRKYPDQWPATPGTFAIIKAIESMRAGEAENAA